ncbi:hypothetical protein PENSPDRAFT_634692 [Peniophora sp. CONT]|nr:hypothetical protein PENSPDRAFT_634692 [Peniophora sp. CONT]
MYPGQSAHYGPPPGEYMPPSGPPGYGGNYGPPPGPPPSGNYGPPPGPPGRPPSNSGNYGPPPGPPGRPPSGNYGPPPGPPPSFNRPPSQSYGGYGGGNDYAPPPGPPHRPPAQEQHYGPHFQNNGQDQQPYFMYSQCTGKRKALCIGINYFGQNAELKGCINDARNIQRFLMERYQYKKEDMVMLTDDQQDPRAMPTKENILRAMQWLVSDAQPNDSLFFHYSGHGGQTKDLDGDEADGYDEVIYPVDFKQNSHIVDDVMHDIMVRPLPPGCRLTAIFDSCHSGSALDLPYIYSTEGKVKEPNLAAEAGQGLLGAVSSYARGDMSGVFSSVSGLFKTATGSDKRANEKAKRTKTSPADVISWSGCKDSQTSADAVEAGTATGAMSFAFISALNQGGEQSYQALLITIRGILKTKYSQKPQLSSSHPMDTNLMFTM